MKKQKIFRVLIFGLLALLFCTLSTIGAFTIAETSDAPSRILSNVPTQRTGGVAARIQKLLKLFPNGSYFTTTGTTCDCDRRKSACSHSNLENVITVLHDKYSEIPTFKQTKLAVLILVAPSARFANFYIFGVNDYSTQENFSKVLLSDAKLGDYVIFKNKRHFAIYLTQDENYFYVYDGNGSAVANEVIYMNKFSKSKNTIEIWHANNYDIVDASVSIPKGTYSIRTLCNTSKALDVNPQVTDPYIWEENANNTQEWKIEPVGCYYKIVNAQTGLALDVKNGKAASGTQVWQYKYNGTHAQLWQFFDAWKRKLLYPFCARLLS